MMLFRFIVNYFYGVSPDRICFDGVCSHHRLSWWNSQRLLPPETEDIPEVIEFSAPDETYAVFAGVAFQPVVHILLVEELKVLRTFLVQTILHGYIIEERLLLSHVVVGASSQQSANLDLQSVVEQSLRELERVIGGFLT